MSKYKEWCFNLCFKKNINKNLILNFYSQNKRKRTTLETPVFILCSNTDCVYFLSWKERKLTKPKITTQTLSGSLFIIHCTANLWGLCLRWVCVKPLALQWVCERQQHELELSCDCASFVGGAEGLVSKVCGVFKNSRKKTMMKCVCKVIISNCSW